MTREEDKANQKHTDVLALTGSGGFMSRVGLIFEDVLGIKCYCVSFRAPPSVKNLLWTRMYGLGSSWLGWGLKPPPEKQEEGSVGVGGGAVRVW